MVKQLKPVIKPILHGSWHGKYAVRKGVKLILSILFISVLYTLLGLLLSFDSIVLRTLTSAILIVFAAFYMYFQGANAGESDAQFSEIMYQHEHDGKIIVQDDRERCFHAGKGFFEVSVALIPFLIVTVVFAVLAQPLTYSLGVLPSWMEAPTKLTHVGDALAYYTNYSTSLFIPILRIIARALTMPFINIALLLSRDYVLWAERLTPFWVCIAPIAYGFGYMQGPKLRIKVNTGIKIGIHNKKRKERKARKVRSASKTPERLI